MGFLPSPGLSRYSRRRGLRRGVGLRVGAGQDRIAWGASWIGYSPYDKSAGMYGLDPGVLCLFTRSVYFITCQELEGLHSRGHEMVPAKHHVSLFLLQH